MFKNAFIPRTLEAVLDFENDMHKARQGDTEEVGKYQYVFRILIRSVYCVGSVVGKVNSAIHRIVIFSNFLNMFSNW